MASAAADDPSRSWHLFEDTYWQTHADWRYDHAALEGSSYLKLTPVLRFLTGNTASTMFTGATRLKLWDERRERLVTFRDARATPRQVSGADRQPSSA